MELQFYKVVPSPGTQISWRWRVVQLSGPAQIIVAESGHDYPSEDAAKTDYAAFIAWASGQPKS